MCPVRRVLVSRVQRFVYRSAYKIILLVGLGLACFYGLQLPIKIVAIFHCIL